MKLTFENFDKAESKARHNKVREVITELQRYLLAYPHVIRNIRGIQYDVDRNVLIMSSHHHDNCALLSILNLIKHKDFLEFLLSHNYEFNIVKISIPFKDNVAKNYSRIYPKVDEVIFTPSHFYSDYPCLDDCSVLDCSCEMLFIQEYMRVKTISNLNKHIEYINVGNCSKLTEVKDINLDAAVFNYGNIKNLFKGNVYVRELSFAKSYIHNLKNIKTSDLYLFDCEIMDHNFLDGVEYNKLYCDNCMFREKKYSDANELLRDIKILKHVTPETQELFGDFL